jgi:hypothetical protein
MGPTEKNPHQRSTAAVILTRDDAHAPATSADPLPPRPRKARRWPIVLIWTILVSAIAALWALLLFGDSLSVSG